MKKWSIIFFVSALCFLSSLAALNLTIDPFGVFGDRFYNWYAFNMTNNPQTAKLAYFKKNNKTFDSYIIGGPAAGSYSVKRLERYTGGNYYNLFSYDGDMNKNLDLINYLIANYEVKQIVLPFGVKDGVSAKNKPINLTSVQVPEVSGINPVRFRAGFLFANPYYLIKKVASHAKDTYVPQEFDAFIPETGEYDSSAGDVEYISGMDEYLTNKPSFNKSSSVKTNLNGIDECIEPLRQIRQLCDDNGITLTIIFSPGFISEYKNYYEDDINKYREAISSVTDYWDFSYTYASYDPRYFYDSVHPRVVLCDMVLARIFNDEDVFFPQDFGTYVEKGDLPAVTLPGITTSDYTVNVPVLMYHHFAESGDRGTTITPAQFEENIASLHDAGHHAVTAAQLMNYVYHGEELPGKPIVITIDDGYYSNYEFAYPILKKYGYNAIISIIGVSVGKNTYKDTDVPIIPHFGLNEMLEMAQSGVISIGSHSYDMHNSQSLDVPYRNGVLRMKGEREIDYIEYFKKDIFYSKEQIEETTGTVVTAFAFPHGIRDVLSDILLRELGFAVTFTTQTGVNTLVKGLPQSLLGLKRINIEQGVTGEDIINMIYEYTP